MAGVIQEIDLVLSQQALARLEGDLARVSQRIGTGIAAGATPAAQTYAKNLITTLETRLRTESTVLARQLAEGALSPVKYAAAAERLGKEIIRDLNRGIKAGGNLELFGGEGGIALKNQLSSLSAIPPIVDKVGSSVSKTTPLVTGLRSAMFSLAASAAGVPGPLGRITGLLLTFTGGAGIAVLAAAAIGLIAIAFDKLTAGAAKSREATQKFLEGIKDLGKTADDIAREAIREAENEVKRIEVRLQDQRTLLERFPSSPTYRRAVQEELENLRKAREGVRLLTAAREEAQRQANQTARSDTGAAGGPQGGSADAEALRLGEVLSLNIETNAERRRATQLLGEYRTELKATTGEDINSQARRIEIGNIIAALTKQDIKDSKEAAQEKRKQIALTLELTKLIQGAAENAAAAVRQQMDELQAKFDELENVPAGLKEQFEKAMKGLGDDLAKTIFGTAFEQQFKDIQASVVEGLGSAALQNIVGELDTLRVTIDKTVAAFDANAPKTAAQLRLEEQRAAIIAKRNELQAKANGLAAEETVIVHRTGEEEDENKKKLEERLTKLQLQADVIHDAATGALQLAEAFGLVDDNLADVLGGLAQAGSHIKLFVEQIESLGKKGGASLGDVFATALPIAGGIAQAVGAIGGLFGESPEARALRESMEKNEIAIRDLSENIKQLDLTITGTGLLAAGRGLGGALGAGGIEQGVFRGLLGASGAASAKADADALDRALRQAGSSLTELQDIANDLGIDIDELTRGQLTQLQRAIQEVDLTAFTRTLEGQLSVFQRFARQAGLTATETLTGIVGRARGTSEAFDKVFQGLDLSTKEGLEAAHERIVQALREVPLLTAEQLGDLSVEGYLALLDEAGGLVSQGLDDLGQAILDAAREAEEAAHEAADLSRRRIGSRRDINELLDRTDPLEIIKGIAGGVPKILQDALAGLDLTREADRDRLDARLQSLFAQLSTGQLERGGLLEGMAPEDFRNLLLEWERLLDEQRQNEADAAERAATEAEQRQRDRERAAEEARREAERLEREREQRERDRLEAKTEAEQLLVDERLALEEQAELRDLEKRARLLGGDPLRAIEEALRLFAEATRLGEGELGADSPLARDARRRALEAQREAERQIEQGERLLGEVVTPGFTVQRTITESSAGHLISELQLQTNWLQRIYERLGGVGNPVINVQPTVAGRGVAGGASEVSIDVSRDLAAEFQRAALLNGNAEMR